jgi:hypothetical protein
MEIMMLDAEVGTWHVLRIKDKVEYFSSNPTLNSNLEARVEDRSTPPCQYLIGLAKRMHKENGRKRMIA